MVTDEAIAETAHKLWAEVYEADFRGKPRGRFRLTRGQLKRALGVGRLHSSTVQRLQDAALQLGLVIVDLDDMFPCVEADVLRRYRRPPTQIFERFFPPNPARGLTDAEDDED